MGKGRDLGLRLKAWLQAGTIDLNSRTALTSALVDLLEADETLQGPIRDLASQPLLRPALLQRGSQQRSAVTALVDHLHRTYAPRVLAELLDLLEAATDLSVAGEAPVDPPGPAPAHPSAPRSLSAPPPPAGRADPYAAAPAPLLHQEPAPTPARRRRDPGGRRIGPLLVGLRLRFQPSAPGVLLGFCAALVLSWAAGELQRWLFAPLGWSSGAILALLLALPQVLTIGPLAGLAQQGSLDPLSATDPRQAWRWITAPWLHCCRLEGILNVLVLLVLLGASPLPLSQAVLRYGLTAVATLALAEATGRRGSPAQIWGGASGVVAALITLAAALSLLHGHALAFRLGALAIPAWVLMLVYGALQFRWILPRRSPDDRTNPGERLLASQWWWGTLLGVIWALITRLLEVLPPGGHG